MRPCFTRPCVTNTHETNHGHVSTTSGLISLESVAEKPQASTSHTNYRDLSLLEREYSRFYCATDHDDF